MNHAKLDNRLADAIARQERMSVKLRRAHNAWCKACDEVKRLDKRIMQRMHAETQLTEISNG